MPRRILRSEIAQAILDAFRERPGNGASAARIAGVNQKTALRAWNVGLSVSCRDEKYHRPFKEILLEEQADVRSELAKEDDRKRKLLTADEVLHKREKRDRIERDAVESRVQEAQMVRTARAAAMVLLNNMTNIAAGVTSLGKKVRTALEERAADPAPLTIVDSKNITQMLGRLTTSLRQCNDAAQRAMEMERLLAGEPTKILGVQHLNELPVDEAERRVKAAARAIETAKGAGATQLDGKPLSLDPKLH